MKIKLFPEEEKTLWAYRKMAKERNMQINGKTFDPDFWAEQFEEFKRFLPSGSILEIGCGNGRDARLFCADKKYKYFGIDACQELLDEVRIWTPEANVCQMNLHSLFFPDNSFDGFWAASVYIHVPKPHILSALKETWRVTKPGGIGFIVMREGTGEKIIPGEKPRRERFYAFYSDEDFSDVLASVGFKILSKSKDTRNKPELIYFVRA